MHDLRVLATRRRAIEDAGTVDVAVDAVLRSRPELSTLAVDDLLTYRARLVDLAVRGSADELAVAAIAVSAFGRLESMLIPYLGPSGSAAAAERVTATAGVSSRPPVEASAAVFAGPTWRELGIEPAVPEPPEDPRAALDEAIQELERELDACPRWRSQQLRHHVRATALERLTSDVVAQLRRRERTKVAVLSLGGEVRRVHLELGRRLCGDEVLSEPTQVDLLSDAELRDALRGRPPSAVLLAQRRRWLERYESEGPLPPRFRGAPERAPTQLPDGDRFEGWATSPGRARGTAKVVRSAVDTLEPGLVLVAEATDASWSPLFVDAAAIVLERGGPLSHAAILARELGVPAVLNVAGATSLLDGHEVLVDGDAGVVVVTDGGSGA
jgi:pyruvate,water dikinase